MDRFKRLRPILKKQLVWYSFLIPTILCLILLTYIPTFTSIKYSFYDVSIVGVGEKFVGLRNYKTLLSSSSFGKAVFNTIILALLDLSVIPIGVILASLINSLGKGKLQSFFRIGFYMPNVITGVSVILLFQVVLKEQGGILNSFLSFMTQQPVEIGWLSNSMYSKFGATIISIWRGSGYTMLISLAGLQSIPSEIYEASEVDGCSGLQKWIYITLPQMTKTFVFLLTTNLIASFSRFTDLYVLSGNSASGRPGGSLQTILMYIYQYSFETPNYGMSSAGAMILFVIVFGVTLVNLKMTGFFKND